MSNHLGLLRTLGYQTLRKWGCILVSILAFHHKQVEVVHMQGEKVHKPEGVVRILDIGIVIVSIASSHEE